LAEATSLPGQIRPGSGLAITPADRFYPLPDPFRSVRHDGRQFAARDVQPEKRAKTIILRLLAAMSSSRPAKGNAIGQQRAPRRTPRNTGPPQENDRAQPEKLGLDPLQGPHE
jgi:hypothetical protein